MKFFVIQSIVFAVSMLSLISLKIATGEWFYKLRRSSMIAYFLSIFFYLSVSYLGFRFPKIVEYPKLCALLICSPVAWVLIKLYSKVIAADDCIESYDGEI